MRLWRRALALGFLGLAVALPTASKPMEEPTVADGLRADAIVVARFVAVGDASQAQYFGGVPTRYALVDVLQGDAPPRDFDLSYAFHDGSACLEPNGWRFDPALLPAPESEWLLFLVRPSRPGESFGTVRGDWGRWESTPTELVRLLAAVPATVPLGDRELGLDVTAERDLQSPLGRNAPLALAIAVGDREARPLPAGLVVEAAWVTHPGGLWRAPEVQTGPATELGKATARVGGGPKLEVGQAIAVVVRLRDAQHRRRLLRQDGLTVRAK